MTRIKIHMVFHIQPVLKKKNGIHKINGIWGKVKNSPINGIPNGQSQEKEEKIQIPAA